MEGQCDRGERVSDDEKAATNENGETHPITPEAALEPHSGLVLLLAISVERLLHLCSPACHDIAPIFVASEGRLDPLGSITLLLEEGRGVRVLLLGKPAVHKVILRHDSRPHA